MAGNSKSGSRRSREEEQGLRDERGRFTPKGAKKYGKEGGEASSGNRSGNQNRGDGRGSQQQRNMRNRNR